MAYTLAYSGGTITVNDGTLNSQTSLSLPGRNYAGYGTFLDQNQLSMLENFASATSGPSNSIKGQVWFDASNNTLKYNTSSTRGTPTWVSTVASGIGQDIRVRNISMESANGTVNGVLTTRNITTGATGTAGTLVGQWNIPAGSALIGDVQIPIASTTQLGRVRIDGTTITINGSGVISAVAGTGSGVTKIVAGSNVTISSSGADGTGIVTINASGGGGGSGVTSVGITSGDLTVTNSPITGSGSIGLSLNTVPINKGGTGQTSAAAAINALMPNQSGNSGALLTTNGTNLSWQAFPRSVGPSGYTTLPGNVILYWGSVTTPNVDIGDHYVMPVTFPAGLFGQVFNVTGIVNSVPSTSGPGGPDAFMSVSNLSATGMNVIFTERNPSFVLSVRTAMFQVIGVPPIPGAPSNVQIAQSWVNNGDGTSNGTLTASSNGNTPLTFNWSYIDSGNVLTWSASGNVATIKSPNNVFNASTSVSVTVTNNVGSAIGSTVAVNPNYEPDGGGGGTFDVSSGGPAPGEAS